MTSQPQTSFQPETVPQLDMSAQYAAIGGDIRTAVERVMASQQFVLGREGMALEEELAKLCGVAADLDPILAFAKSHKLPVIEDNAQAIGASHKGRRTGSLGDAGCVSFYPTKNLGAYGDAGMVLTNSAELAARIRSLRNHGQAGKIGRAH